MNGKPWTPEQLELLRAIYPDKTGAEVAAACEHSLSSTYRQASKLALDKSEAFKQSDLSVRIQRGKQNANMIAHRFQKGQVPPNKGLRRPGWAPGRMRESQFKKGCFPANKDPDFYVVGALRVNSDGYIDMRVSFEKGAMGWQALHRILWQDEHGPIPTTHKLVFKDGDRLNVCMENLELITNAEMCRRNIQRIPPELRSAMQLLGRVKSTITRRSRNAQGY